MQLEKQEAMIENRKADILQKANEEARDIVADAKQLADETIRSFRGFAAQAPMREMEQKRSGLREQMNKCNCRHPGSCFVHEYGRHRFGKAERKRDRDRPLRKF